MGILLLKKRVNCDKCSFTTKQHMFGVFPIAEILRYRWTWFVGLRTLCHPGWKEGTPSVPNGAKNTRFFLFFFAFEIIVGNIIVILNMMTFQSRIPGVDCCIVRCTWTGGGFKNQLRSLEQHQSYNHPAQSFISVCQIWWRWMCNKCRICRYTQKIIDALSVRLALSFCTANGSLIAA